MAGHPQRRTAHPTSRILNPLKDSLMLPDDFLEQLNTGDDQKAEAAAQKFASLGSEAIPALQDLLSNPNQDLRWWAVRALAEIQDQRTPSLLQSALHDPHLFVRQCAALALRQQPTPQAVPDLIALLEDEDRLLARLAADALIAAGEVAVPALLEVLQFGPQIARLEAVRALAMIGDHRSIPTLFAALGEPSALIEYWADQGLQRMGVGMVFFKPGE